MSFFGKVGENFARKWIEKSLEQADIKIDGSRPFDIKVHDSRFFLCVLSGGSLAFGEAYMAGWWDSEQVDETVSRLLNAKIERKTYVKISRAPLLLYSLVFNRQSSKRSFQVGEEHYDIGNDLYGAMLDSRKVYTCGYWKRAKNLEEAQEAKLDLVCKKLGLKKGDSVLDIGCGWGSFLKFAAEKYGVRGVGITVSKEQAHLARESLGNLPVEIRVEDYRETQGEFDHVVSLGMFEHVGYKNYRSYMKVVKRVLKDNGLFLLHTIGGNRSVVSTDPWIEKYIFPNGMLPSISQIGKSIEGVFVMEDWHNFGTDYDKTLMEWFSDFDNSWTKLEAKYGSLVGGKFYRMWKYYLLASAGSFRSRKNQLWQVVLSKDGVSGGYKSIR